MLIHLLIVDAEEILVGEKYLERRRSIRDNLAQLRFCLGVVARHRHVKGVIAGAVAFGLLLPDVVALQRIFIARRADISMNVVVPPISAALLAVACVSLAKVAMKGR